MVVVRLPLYLLIDFTKFFHNFSDEMFAKHLGSDVVSEVDLGRWSRRSHSRIIMYLFMQCRNYNYGNFHVGRINQWTNQGWRYVIHMIITQCGNFMIFVSFRFYMKSILRILEGENQPFYHIRGFEFSFS